MSENLIKIKSSGNVMDEFAQEEDKRKAYQIFGFSAVLSVVLTVFLYFLTFLF